MRINLMPTKAMVTAAFLAAAVFAAPAHAQVVNNGSPDNRNGFPIDADITIADNFVLAGTTSLGAFNWWNVSINTGSNASTINASYTVNLYANSGGAPGAVLNSYSVNGTGTLTNYACCTGSQSTSDDYRDYAFSANLGGFTLGAGTYWVGITNFSSPGEISYWATSNNDGGDSAYSFDGEAWNQLGREMAFNIDAAQEVAPEPASLVLLGTGLMGIAAVARRKRI